MKPLREIRAGCGRNRATIIPSDGPSHRAVLHCGQAKLLVIATCLEGWEHVSVSVFTDRGNASCHRCPTWEEMRFVRDFFWGEDEIVTQFYCPQVKDDGRCLHLWRPADGQVRLPGPELLGHFIQYAQAATRK